MSNKKNVIITPLDRKEEDVTAEQIVQILEKKIIEIFEPQLFGPILQANSDGSFKGDISLLFNMIHISEKTHDDNKVIKDLHKLFETRWIKFGFCIKNFEFTYIPFCHESCLGLKVFI